MGACVLMLTAALAVVPEPEFLDAHDMIWERAPERWLEGIPLANGHIGALIWGDGAPLRFTLDRYDAWETREDVLGEGDITYARLRELVAQGKRKEAEDCLNGEQYSGRGGLVPYPTRLPMPRLEVDFGDAFTWREGRLRLRQAKAEIAGSVAGEDINLDIAVHDNQNVMIVRLSGRPAAGLQVRLGLDHLDKDAKETLAKWGYAEPEVAADENHGSLCFQSPTGYRYAVAWERRPVEGGAILCVASFSSEDTDDPLTASRDLAASACAGEVDLASHEEGWREYWKKSYLAIPDARFESLYYIEMYKLRCSSRPGGYPATLQGLWTLDGGMPPWSGDYHLDMNVQETYWPVYTANRLELGAPLYEKFSACIPRWREQCRQFFGSDGIWPGCAIGPRGERIFGYSAVEVGPGNGAWLAHMYWLHFKYSQDVEFLKEHALPMIRLAFLTYANLLERGDDGKLHVPLSNSPEWGEGSFEAYVKDPTYDLALIRFLCKAILESNDVLGTEDEVTPRVREVVEGLVDYPTKGGQLLISEGTPLAHSHRHHSHLIGIYPLGVLNMDGTEAERALIEGSLHEIRVKGTGEWTGWSFPWMSLIASRAGYGNMAWQMLDMYANSFIKPNTFHVNGDPRRFGVSLFTYEPMTMEAGFAAAAGVMEMLLQSHGGRIRVFPSMPDRWHDAYFSDLLAEGAFEVTSRMDSGQVAYVAVRSLAGGQCEIVNPWEGQVHIQTLDESGAVKIDALEGDTLRFPTAKSASYLLFQGQIPTKEAMDPLVFQRDGAETNFYGVKKLARF